MLETYKQVRESARQLESYRAGNDEHRFYDELETLLAGKQIDTKRISLRAIFEEFVPNGRERVREMDPRYRGSQSNISMMEANDGVSTTAFSNIIGQITYASVLDRLDAPEFIGQSLVTTVAAATQDVEIIPGISVVGDVAEDIGEMQEYPVVGLSEEFVTAPRKVKDGFILPISEEAIFEDKTGLLMQRADTATEGLGITWEREILDTCLGQTTSYSRNGGSAQATYANTHTEGTFDNLSASTALQDWTDVQSALLLFDGIDDPITGDPVMIGGPLQIVVPSALRGTLARILSATEIREVTNTNTTSISGNPLNSSIAGLVRGTQYEGYSGPFIKDRTSSDDTWFIGNFKKAFEYREIWPIQVFRADRNSDAGFTRDVVTAIKVRRKGAPAIRDPRYVVKATA